MIATYAPEKEGKRLNIRREPNASASIVRTMEAGTVKAEAVLNGWVKLEDGYADARFLTVTEGTEEAAEVEEAVEAAEVEEAVDTTDEDARERLTKMTNAQLYSLASESGIKVAKGSTKAELVEAILNGADE